MIRLRWIRMLFFTALGVIFILSVWPSEKSDYIKRAAFAKEELKFVSSVAYMGEDYVKSSDKYRHILAFVTLAFLFDLSYFIPDMVKFALLALYGIVIELVQWALPYRDFDMEDLLFNILSVALFYIFTRYVFKNFYAKFYEKYKGVVGG